MPEITRITPVNNASIGGGSTNITVYYKNVGNSTGNRVKFEYQTMNSEGKKTWEQIGGVLYGQQSYNTSLHYSRCQWDYNEVMNGVCEMRVTLIDADGNTDIQEFTYIIDTQGPIPTDEIKIKSEDGVIQLLWSESDSADCVSYKVYRSLTEQGPYSLLATVNKNEYTDKNVETDRTYYYKISGVDNFAQEGELSEIASVKVSNDNFPPQIVSISVKDQRINKCY